MSHIDSGLSMRTVGDSAADMRSASSPEVSAAVAGVGAGQRDGVTPRAIAPARGHPTRDSGADLDADGDTVVSDSGLARRHAAADDDDDGGDLDGGGGGGGRRGDGVLAPLLGRGNGADSDGMNESPDAAPPTAAELVREAYVARLYRKHRYYTPGVVLALYTCVNMLTYMDRGSVTPAVQYIAVDATIAGVNATLTQSQTGAVYSVFMAGFFVMTPVFVGLGGVLTSKLIINIGIGVWAAAVVLAAVSQSYPMLMFARALTGVGEAAYASFTVTIVDNVCPRASRTMWIGIFYSTIAFGTAMGIALNGVVSPNQFAGVEGWRVWFCAESVPMLVLFAVLSFMPAEYNVRPEHRGDEEIAAAAVDAEDAARRVPPSFRVPRGSCVNDGVGDNTRAVVAAAVRDAAGVDGIVGEVDIGSSSSSAGAAAPSSSSAAAAAPAAARLGAGKAVGADASVRIGTRVADGESGSASGGSGGGDPSSSHVPMLVALRSLMCNANFLLLACGYGAYTFVLGALSFFGVEMLTLGPLHVSTIVASVLLGGSTAIIGLIGSIVGGTLVDRWGGSKGWQGVYKCSLMLALCMLIAVPSGYITLALTNLAAFCVLFVFTVWWLFLITAPLNTALLTVVPSELRPYSVALAILIMHLFGDFPSAPLTGALADAFDDGCRSFNSDREGCLAHNTTRGFCRFVPKPNAHENSRCINTQELVAALQIVWTVLAAAVPLFGWVAVRVRRHRSVFGPQEQRAIEDVRSTEDAVN